MNEWKKEWNIKCFQYCFLDIQHIQHIYFQKVLLSAGWRTSDIPLLKLYHHISFNDFHMLKSLTKDEFSVKENTQKSQGTGSSD